MTIISFFFFLGGGMAILEVRGESGGWGGGLLIVLYRSEGDMDIYRVLSI